MVMALEIALRAVNLVVKAEELSAQVTAAVGGNNSANKRARKLSVQLREEFKELRQDLLQLEKDRK
jgi:hypothetical protein